MDIIQAHDAEGIFTDEDCLRIMQKDGPPFLFASKEVPLINSIFYLGKQPFKVIRYVTDVEFLKHMLETGHVRAAQHVQAGTTLCFYEVEVPD